MKTELELLAPERPPAIFRANMPTTRTSSPTSPSPLGAVQVADEAGFAYLSGDIDFGATGRNEIFQNIRFIVLTEFFSVPLDREFGMDYSMVDKPMAIAEAIFAQEVAMKITLYEPRAQFREINYVRDEMIGKLSPSVVVVLLTTEELPSLYQTSVAIAGGTVAATTPTPVAIATPEAFSGSITGLPGSQGPAGTVAVGTTTTGEPGTDASVINTGTPSAAVLDFTIPRGDKGEQGTGITIKGQVPNSGALPATGNEEGDMWIAADTGHGWSWDGTQWIDVGPIQGPPGATGPTGATGAQGPQGPTGTAATIAAGTTITGAAGTQANVVNVGSSSAAVFNFTIPQGIQGVKGDQGIQGIQGIQGPTGLPGTAATITVGTTTTGAAGSAANVTNTGTTSAAVLNFTIPQGIKGDQGIQGVQGVAGPANVLSVSGTTTGAPGTNASVSISGTSPSQSLAFTIPRGDAGPQGDQGPPGAVRLPINYLTGFRMINTAGDTANSLSIWPGSCRSDDNTYDIVLPSTLTKKINAIWAGGDNQGGRETGSTLVTGSWHVYVIANTSTGAVDAMFTTSGYSGGPVVTLPSGFTVKRRIGSIRYNAQIWQFMQTGNYIMYVPAIVDCNDGQPGVGAQFAINLSTPYGYRTLVTLTIRCYTTAGGTGVWSVFTPGQTSGPQPIINSPAANVAGGSGHTMMTDTNTQIVCLYNSGGPVAHVFISTSGYLDFRGTDGYYGG